MTSSFKNTITVWRALFLREALDRFFGSRGGWAWLAIEPAIHLCVLAAVVSLYRQLLNNVDVFTWVCVGLIAFFLFRRTAVQTQHAIDCNKAFFAFRQVRPFDAALSRAAVEGFSMFLVAICIFIPMAFFGKDILPVDPLLYIVSMFGLWFFGLSFGLITSTIQRLVPETKHIFMVIMLPLYFLSGAIWPLNELPAMARDYVLFFPLIHGVEYCRYAFLEHYYLYPGVSLSYLYLWIMVFLFIGMIFYKFFEPVLIRR